MRTSHSFTKKTTLLNTYYNNHIDIVIIENSKGVSFSEKEDHYSTFSLAHYHHLHRLKGMIDQMHHAVQALDIRRTNIRRVDHDVLILLADRDGFVHHSEESVPFLEVDSH